MTDKSYLDEVKPQQAMHHAMWEASICINSRAFCASLAMLRTALEIWSAAYRDKHGLTFDKKVGEQDSLYCRLQKIASANPLYAESIHNFVDGLRLGARDVLHRNSVCKSRPVTSIDGASILALKGPYQFLYTTIEKLINLTAGDLFKQESKGT